MKLPPVAFSSSGPRYVFAMHSSIGVTVVLAQPVAVSPWLVIGAPPVAWSPRRKPPRAWTLSGTPSSAKSLTSTVTVTTNAGSLGSKLPSGSGIDTSW